MSSHLSVFQISADAEELYRRILRSGPSTLAPYAAELGWSLSLATEALESLIGNRLVRETVDGLILVEHPRPALERLLGDEEARLDTRRRELADARAAIARFTAEHRAAGDSRGAADTKPVWEIVSSQMAVSMVEHAVRSTTGLIRNSVLSLKVGPGLDEEGVRMRRGALAGGREQRAIYSMEALEDPAGRRWVRALADAGEQQRVSASPPSEFAIFGDEVVLAVAEWRSAESDHIIIRNPMLIAAFTAMFDYAWELAQPVPGVHGHRTGPTNCWFLLCKRLQGRGDRAVPGMGPADGRRRVAALMDLLSGQKPRFRPGSRTRAVDSSTSVTVLPPSGRRPG